MRKLALSIGLTLALAPTLFFTCQPSQAGSNQQITAYLVQFPIERQVMKLTALEGEIRSSKYTQLIAENDGKIDAIHVQDGEVVEKGTPLFSYDASLLKLALKATENEYQFAMRNFIELNRTGHEDDPRIKTASRAVDKTRSNLLKTQRALASTTVYAPFAGKIGQIHFDTGNRVKQGDLISELVATDTIEVHFEASPAVLNTFRQVLNDQPDKIQTSLMSEDGSYIDGKLKYVDSTISSEKENLAAYAVFDNSKGRHLIGSKTTLYLNSPTLQPQLFVPKTSIHTTDGIPTLFVLDEKRRVKPKQVTLATIKDDYTGYVPIEAGVKPTDFILTTPNAPELVGKKIDPMVNLVNQLNEILSRTP